MKKRLVAATVPVVLAAALTGGAQAHAASADPVKSLRKQFAEGRGVLVSETSRVKVPKPEDALVTATRTTGRIGFGNSGAVSHDLRTRYKFDREQVSEEVKNELEQLRQEVKVGRYTYVRGFDWGPMPAGKTWIRFGKSASWGLDGQRGSQVVDVLDPAILRTLVAKATVRKPGEYRGVLTANDLSKEKVGFPGFAKVSFRLFVNRDQLPVRLITEYAYKYRGVDQDGKKVEETFHPVTDTRYTGWGTKVKIVPPPAAEVVDFGDLEGPFADGFGDSPIIPPGLAGQRMLRPKL
ncbi:hypothetical protein [Nonomuraea sp. NPDC049709]|uniref:hypothetical protein n=1 Tax=Nonomuraea sp. NPDC049709 TaxID=3154736 RepID=UPI00343D4D8E